MKCTHCGAALTAGAWSCPGCGLKFTQPVPADPTEAPQVPSPPPYASPQPVQSPPPYAAPPPQSGQAPPYGQAPSPQFGQALPPTQKKSKLPMALGIGCVVLLVLGIVLIRGIVVAAQHVIAEGTKTGTSTPTTTAPVVTATPPTTPAGSNPDVVPPPDSTPSSGSDADNATALSANMTKFGECLQQFGAINSQPRLDDPVWKQQMEQNTQDMKTLIGEERQITWPSTLQPAKDNYESGLNEYEYLADHWPAAVENGDMSALQDCQNHAERAKTLVLQAEAQIKQLTGS
jgi:hypothetical protein